MRPLLQRVSTAEAVVNYFKERIGSGELKPGDALPSERALQKTLVVSRFALREGLARLNALGIITSAQGKASVVNSEVSSLSLGDVFLPMAANDGDKYASDLFYSRTLIEKGTCALAARNRTKADIERLEGLLAEARGKIDAPADFTELDLSFHRELARVSGNVFLHKILEMLQGQLEDAISRSTQTMAHRTKSLSWHEQILACIRKGQADGAAAAVAKHLAACEVAYRKSL